LASAIVLVLFVSVMITGAGVCPAGVLSTAVDMGCTGAAPVHPPKIMRRMASAVIVHRPMVFRSMENIA
jgi:hypothetical protein